MSAKVVAPTFTIYREMGGKFGWIIAVLNGDVVQHIRLNLPTHASVPEIIDAATRHVGKRKWVVSGPDERPVLKSGAKP